LSSHQSKHILISPLDWGLGHTARCAPLIRYIRSLGHKVTIAGNAWQRSFIEETFGAIDFIHLDGYDIVYSASNKILQAGLISQLPKVLNTINYEHKWLLQVAGELQPDGIISDNRYGLYHPTIPSVIITHQLRVQSGVGDLADSGIQKQHYKFLNRFQETWVADTGGTPNLAGKLSHPANLPRTAKYIGLLSRFAELPLSPSNTKNDELLILLSGPEPQRSILSGILWKHSVVYPGHVTFVEGNEAAAPPASVPPNISYYKRLTESALGPLLINAGMVICRSGYSTIMDLVALQKKAILIPTPGQTEQEYLGKHLHNSGVFYCTRQDRFDLNASMKAAALFPFAVPALQHSFNDHKSVINDWLLTL